MEKLPLNPVQLSIIWDDVFKKLSQITHIKNDNDISEPLKQFLELLNIKKGDDLMTVRIRVEEYLINQKLTKLTHFLDKKRIYADSDISKRKHGVLNELQKVQNDITSYGYNHTCIPAFFEIKKHYKMNRVMRIAADIEKYKLPIKCLEAVVLAVYNTCKYENIVRFALSFLSISNGREYRHIVLCVYHEGKFGALGISRKKELMDKEVKYKSLIDLINEYKYQYHNVGHELIKVHLSAPFGNDIHSPLPIVWRQQTLDLKTTQLFQLHQETLEYLQNNDIRP